MKPTHILWLRLSYWAGAIVDVAAGLMMIWPPLFALLNGLESFEPIRSEIFLAGMGAPLMFGWAVLLLWADRKPMERKAILLVTLIPILGNAVNQVYGVWSGFLSLPAVIPLWLNQVLLTVLYIFSYWNAVRSE